MCCSTLALMRWASGIGTVRFFMNSCSTSPPSKGVLSVTSPSHLRHLHLHTTMHMPFLSLILLFLLSRYDLFPFDTRLSPSLLSDRSVFLQEMCVLSTENLSRRSKHTIMIYFWKKNSIERKITNLQYLMRYIQKSHINPSTLIEESYVWVCR